MGLLNRKKKRVDLTYRDETDRCYGATGVAIGVVVLDIDEYIDHISIDAPAGNMVEFTQNYYFAGNPGISAKTAWNQLLHNYNVSMVSMLANVLCRTIINNGMPVRFETKQLLHDVISEEGRDTCSLEDDEIDRLFDKNYDYLYRIFNHRGVQGVAHEFAETIAQRRTMSRYEILEALKSLSLI